MSRETDAYPTSAFDYELPADRIARYPAERRDESRLLVLHREDGRIEHRVFHDIAELIPAGDALVLNETRVFPARLLGRRASGAEAEVLLLHPHGDTGTTDWTALVRPGARLKPGRFIQIADGFQVEILDTLEDGVRVVRLHAEMDVDQAISTWGRIPLPPYIDRDAESHDTERYQTVYARERGSVAAPTAGLHFTAPLLERIEAAGVSLVRVVLHVGVGTFRPVEVEDPAQHLMHAEHYEVPPSAAAVLNDVRSRGGRIWAVGTTVVRTLETVTDDAGCVHAGSGWTRIFIRPPYRFKGVDRLITNFHLPRSTLLMLVSALGGYDSVMNAYAEAVADGYRFYSYGDAMVIL